MLTFPSQGLVLVWWGEKYVEHQSFFFLPFIAKLNYRREGLGLQDTQKQDNNDRYSENNSSGRPFKSSLLVIADPVKAARQIYDSVRVITVFLEFHWISLINLAPNSLIAIKNSLICKQWILLTTSSSTFCPGSHLLT